MKIIFKVIFLVIGLMCMLFMKGQNSEGLGNWYILNMKYNINNDWSVFAESQLRSLQFNNEFNYYEFKGGVNYKFKKKFKVTIGAGSYQTYRDGGNFLTPKNNDEFIVWPQFVLFHEIGKFKVEQRYRSELRFTTNGYRNRYRYRIGVSYPFGKVVDGYKPFQLSTSNEMFFTDSEQFFERNRVIIALSIKTSTKSTFQIGYLHQFDNKINDAIGRDFLKVGYFIEIFSKQNKDNQSADDLKDD